MFAKFQIIRFAEDLKSGKKAKNNDKNVEKRPQKTKNGAKKDQ